MEVPIIPKENIENRPRQRKVAQFTLNVPAKPLTERPAVREKKLKKFPSFEQLQRIERKPAKKIKAVAEPAPSPAEPKQLAYDPAEIKKFIADKQKRLAIEEEAKKSQLREKEQKIREQQQSLNQFRLMQRSRVSKSRPVLVEPTLPEPTQVVDKKSKIETLVEQLQLIQSRMLAFAESTPTPVLTDDTTSTEQVNQVAALPPLAPEPIQEVLPTAPTKSMVVQKKRNYDPFSLGQVLQKHSHSTSLVPTVMPTSTGTDAVTSTSTTTQTSASTEEKSLESLPEPVKEPLLEHSMEKHSVDYSQVEQSQSDLFSETVTQDSMDSSVDLSVAYFNIEYYLEKEKARFRDNEALLRLQKRTLKDQTRTELLYLKEQRRQFIKKGSCQKLIDNNMALENALRLRYATQRAELNRKLKLNLDTLQNRRKVLYDHKKFENRSTQVSQSNLTSISSIVNNENVNLQQRKESIKQEMMQSLINETKASFAIMSQELAHLFKKEDTPNQLSFSASQDEEPLLSSSIFVANDEQISPVDDVVMEHVIELNVAQETMNHAVLAQDTSLEVVQGVSLVTQDASFDTSEVSIEEAIDELIETASLSEAVEVEQIAKVEVFTTKQVVELQKVDEVAFNESTSESIPKVVQEIQIDSIPQVVDEQLIQEVSIVDSSIESIPQVVQEDSIESIPQVVQDEKSIAASVEDSIESIPDVVQKVQEAEEVVREDSIPQVVQEILEESFPADFYSDSFESEPQSIQAEQVDDEVAEVAIPEYESDFESVKSDHSKVTQELSYSLSFDEYQPASIASSIVAELIESAEPAESHESLLISAAKIVVDESVNLITSLSPASRKLQLTTIEEDLNSFGAEAINEQSFTLEFSESPSVSAVEFKEYSASLELVNPLIEGSLVQEIQERFENVEEVECTVEDRAQIYSDSSESDFEDVDIYQDERLLEEISNHLNAPLLDQQSQPTESVDYNLLVSQFLGNNFSSDLQLVPQVSLERLNEQNPLNRELISANTLVYDAINECLWSLYNQEPHSSNPLRQFRYSTLPTPENVLIKVQNTIKEWSCGSKVDALVVDRLKSEEKSWKDLQDFRLEIEDEITNELFERLIDQVFNEFQ